MYIHTIQNDLTAAFEIDSCGSNDVVFVFSLEPLGIELDDPSLAHQAQIVCEVMANFDDTKPFTPELFDAIKKLWADKGVQKTHSR